MRICTGFGEIRLLRADVERLAAAVIELDRRPRAGASLPAKELLEAAAARVLREKFSERPSDTVGELCTMVTRALGRKTAVSKKTIERAMRRAW